MWHKLPVKERMSLMQTYRDGGFSYRDAVKDYNDSYQKFGNGGQKIGVSSYQDEGSKMTAQQWNESNYEKSLAQARKEIINDHVEKGFNNTVNNPAFKAVASLTPIGMGVGSIEGAANLVPDIYKGDYGKAGLDALQMTTMIGSNIKNAYKLNPNRFRPDPEAYYHRSPDLDQVLVDNKLVGYGVTPGGKEITEAAIKKYGRGIVNLKKAANDEPYFSKGTPLDWGRYNPIKNNWAGRNGEIAQGYPGPYLAESKGADFVAKADNRLQKVWNPDGTFQRGVAPNEIGAYATPVEGYVPKDNLNFYKEHWWKGYKQINK